MESVYHDKTYLNLVRDVLENGSARDDRTGTGTVGVFGRQMRFDLSNGSIPMLTTKKIHTRSIIHEILWYLTGVTNTRYLKDNNVRIWDEWADKNGELGPIYGEQWRSWPKSVIDAKIDYSQDPSRCVIEHETIDQIAIAIDKIKNNPTDRRIIISAWNVGQLDEMALPPCHAFFQFWVNGNELSCQLYQRSCDVGLGVPFNIVQYSILIHMIAHVTGLVAKEFIWVGGDVHIYNNHIQALEGQLEISPLPSPTLTLNSAVTDIDDFVYDDFEINNYESHPIIKMEVSV